MDAPPDGFFCVAFANAADECIICIMRKIFHIFWFAAAAAMAGCAPADRFQEEGAFDPIEPINRAVYGFNKKADFFIMRPAAKVYDYLPSFSKNAVDNFYFNLGEPRNIVNHVMQKRGDDAVRSTARFVFNTVFGGFGLVDFADDQMGIQGEKNDFGRTIRAYSRAYTDNDGAYIVLPFFGPSSVADAPGAAGDGFLSPPAYLNADSARAGLGALGATKIRAGFLEKEELLESALDEYSFVRDTVEERRRRDIPSDVWGRPEDIWGK